MQTFQIEVEDQIADRVLRFLENLKDGVNIKRVSSSVHGSELHTSSDDFDYENNYPEELVVSSVEEVRARVYEAENRIENGEFHTEDEYNRLMDKFFEEELGIQR